MESLAMRYPAGAMKRQLEGPKNRRTRKGEKPSNKMH